MPEEGPKGLPRGWPLAVRPGLYGWSYSCVKPPGSRNTGNAAATGNFVAGLPFAHIDTDSGEKLQIQMGVGKQRSEGGRVSRAAGDGRNRIPGLKSESSPQRRRPIAGDPETLGTPKPGAPGDRESESMLFVEFQVHVGVGVARETLPAIVGCGIHVSCFSVDRGIEGGIGGHVRHSVKGQLDFARHLKGFHGTVQGVTSAHGDRKSTRLNSSHL